MTHRLPLSRVARLVGVSRSALQQMIRSGDLATFDGDVELEEVLRVFPDARLEDDSEIRRVEALKDAAVTKSLLERTLPDKEVLAERLSALGRDFAAAKSLLLHYDQVFDWLDAALDDLAEATAPPADAVADLKQRLRRHRQGAPGEAASGRALLARDSLLRIVSAHVKVLPSGRTFFVEGNDTILEAALRSGLPLAYGCSNGNCGKCRVRLVSGQVKRVHPHDHALDEAQRQGGVFLPCSYTAVTDLVIEAPLAGVEDMPDQRVAAKVRQVEPLDERVVALHLTTPRNHRLRFLAGQSVTLDADGVAAEYPVASCPCDDREITLHIRRDNSPFARKVFEDLLKGDVVTVSGPHGRTVLDMGSDRPALFIAWDDGFAPIGSLVQHALSLDMAGPLHLVWVADRLGHYRDNLCRSWAAAYEQLGYRALSAAEGGESLVFALHPDLSGCDVYAAAPAEVLARLRDTALAHGLPPDRWRGEAVG